MRKVYDIWADGTRSLDVKIQEMFLIWNCVIAQYGFDKVGFHKIEQLGCAVRITFEAEERTAKEIGHRFNKEVKETREY